MSRGIGNYHRAIVGRTGMRVKRRNKTLYRLSKELRLANIDLRPEDVLNAGRTAGFAALIALSATSVITWFLFGTGYVLPCAVATFTVPYIVKESVNSYPTRLATRRSGQVLRHSADATNLMIMSLRHEPSIPKALAFASTHKNEFSDELKGCTWGVIMGRFESFEEALLGLGDKWAALGDDLKTSLSSMVTSAREATQDGRRRALDRANQAMVAGGKRRIEAYALSLTTPSMLIFGLGILLPLMAGSFLPMLSWDMWSMDSIGGGDGVQAHPQSTQQMVFIMNLLFPAIALLIAMNAVAGHPLESNMKVGRKLARARVGALAMAACTCVLVSVIWLFVESSVLRSILLLFSGIGPISIWLLISSERSNDRPLRHAEDLEDVLFRAGARMLEGENFESSLHHAAVDLDHTRSGIARKVSLRWILAVDKSQPDSYTEHSPAAVRNALEGIRIVKEAASKDEPAAGMLAMDIASYLKDLRELEATLRNRLKPTISMMKTTALFLAPIVLGVTYAIYLSLASMLGGAAGTPDESLFFLVLGVFLAQMNAIVVYFVWGIEGKSDTERLWSTIGSYIIVSELAYSATALVAST